MALSTPDARSAPIVFYSREQILDTQSVSSKFLSFMSAKSGPAQVNSFGCFGCGGKVTWSVRDRDLVAS